MDLTPPATSQQDFGTTYPQWLFKFVRAELADDGVRDLLHGAGETRTEREIIDEGAFCSYEQMRRLLETASLLLGGTRHLKRAASADIEDNPEMWLEIIQSLQIPENLLRVFPKAIKGVSRLLRAQAEELGPQDWRVTTTLDSGYEPFPELCALMQSGLGVNPQLFGFRKALVVEEQCQLLGDPACVFRMRWNAHEATAHGKLLERQVEVLENRLDEYRQTIGDLVVMEDFDATLTRILASACRAVQASTCVLLLDQKTIATRPIYFAGSGDQTAEAIVTQVRQGPVPDSWLDIPVTSNQRTYGRLIAVRDSGGFFSVEPTTLGTYAQIVSAALDRAGAMADAEEQGITTRSLLELSLVLAEVAGLDDMASKLAKAVTKVIDCDSSTVIVTDPGTGRPRIAATHGWSESTDAFVRAEGVSPAVTSVTEMVTRDIRDPNIPETNRKLLEATGVVYSMLIPILINGEWLGAVAAAVSHTPERLCDRPQVQERLAGLAAQASTAIQNARLLDQMKHQALHDALTGLPNRALIMDRAHQMLVRARRQGNPAAALFLDLDGFKEVNDTLGHATGDALLQAVTSRLRGALRESDTVGRLGGDEFVVLLDGTTFDVGPELVAERLLTVLREPFLIHPDPTKSISISVSVGVATGDRVDASELLRDADVALYRAKNRGKDCYVVFAEDMQSASQERLLLQMDVAQALEENQFSLVYQPIFSMSTGAVTGVEALLRWQHPVKGELQPTEFITILEESGWITKVGQWVLRQACQQAVQWREQGLPLTMAVNVSVKQLEGEGLADDIRAALASSGLESHMLIIEITESAVMSHLQGMTRRLRELKDTGVRVAIDNFGTGYSSLAKLRGLAIDTIKIDRTFVAALESTPDSASIVSSLVHLAKSLGLETVGEGIENEGQYAQLDAQHCDSGQGFLMARPMTPDALASFLSERARTSSLSASA